MGTDVAMMLGIAHAGEEKSSRQSLPEKYTTGYPQFEEYLLGKSDKIGENRRVGIWRVWRAC